MQNYEIVLNEIIVLERSIVKCKNYSAVTLCSYLTSLNKLRKQLYNFCYNIAQNDESLKSMLIQEYSRFCNFNYDLLKTKKLSNANFFEILLNLLNKYEWIKPLDINENCKNVTKETLKSIYGDLDKSNIKMKNYRLRGINLLLKQVESQKEPQMCKEY